MDHLIMLYFSIANCSEKIDLVALEVFSRKAYLRKTLPDYGFDWTSITMSFHRAFGHLVEAIRRNDGFGLGNISESCLESAHKILR